MWRADPIEGKTEQAKGRIKKAVAELTDDEDLKREGQKWTNEWGHVTVRERTS